MGAITAVPREVVPLVNHSAGFAVLRGSGVLSRADIAGCWGLGRLTAAGGEKSRGLAVSLASLLCSLLTIVWAAGAGCVKACRN